ncbi:SDR family oxidoreductase [Brevibacterium sp. 50QC2O2]|uniref:SDR family oxidoreductase n=1 Tax=Brevibacterium sp. 50QC2O2 TaxID=2968459 RepID=UPI00211C4B1D|nr:SDR family oxidoreductase [Brevibacterium sp. 50QC2O2]MCQ9389820.1 SDR family oxidoreductase [Brevibacterium sp. 50QC2O2]
MSKTALVTGASRGIGQAIAADLARDHRVFGGASKLPESSSGPVEFFATDLAASPLDLSALPDIDSLDVLVHNAGIGIEKRLEESTREDWERSFAVNVFAVADITRHYLPALRAAKGTIVFINSGSGMMSYAKGLPYTGTKFALRTLADCLREEVRADGIQVVSVHPGFVDTDMGRGIRADHGVPYDPDTFIRPETMAQAVRVAVDSEPAAQFESIVVRPMNKGPEQLT